MDTGEGISDTLDLASVLKATRAISGEISLENLLIRLMKIIVEYAGAQRGFLILFSNERLRVEGQVETNEVRVLESHSLDEVDSLSRSIVRYVIRTGEHIVFFDAAENIAREGRFKEDPYILKNHPRSILCMPIRHQDQVTGALYLENNISAGAFTEDRMEILEILLAQAAISLENAKVYNKLEELVEERTRELEVTHKRLLDTAHRAGMAEVASNVLHNVGNALNSALVPAGLLKEGLSGLRLDSLQKLSLLLEENRGKLGEFFTIDERGKKLPEFIGNLKEYLYEERENMSGSLTRLQKSLTHIKEIIRLQQFYAGGLLLEEKLDPRELLEDALRIEGGALESDNIKIIRKYTALPPLKTDRHKLMMILINLLSNARYALANRSQSVKTIRLILESDEANSDKSVRVKIQDNGMGIPVENLEKIFQYGFTTRSDGHGFGLHGAANAMTELGGRLIAQSDGPGLGATFILELPSTSQ